MSSPIHVEERAMTRLSPFVVMLATALSASGTGLAARAQDLPPGDIANGKRVYLATGCFTCHGRAGQGGAYNGPAPTLAKTVVPFEGFKMQIRNPSNDMPAYSEPVMSDREIADIYAFMQSLPGRGNPKDIAILND
ncbi:MAG: c-type cytochrome [Xanthobacteraceae bacterium]|jgi:mono/diheme cytochrome c family protein